MSRSHEGHTRSVALAAEGNTFPNIGEHLQSTRKMDQHKQARWSAIAIKNGRVLSPSETNMHVGRISLTNDSNKVKPSMLRAHVLVS